MSDIEFINYLKDLKINLSEKQLKQFQKYYELLVEWNEKINLTAITKKEDVYLKHFYDSACIVKAVDLNKISTLCDVGSGAGFPGIVIKILFPNVKVVLVDALNKRINFLKLVIKELDLKLIEVYHERAEIYALNNREKFEVVTARAVAPLNILSELCFPLVSLNGYFVPLKGNISNEIINLDNIIKKLGGSKIIKYEFTLPKENSQRTILKIEKKFSTALKYPRKYSEIKKHSL